MRYFPHVFALYFSSLCLISPSKGEDVSEKLPLKLPVTIIDSTGQPVSGAKILPWALGSDAGHGQWGAGHGEALTVTTNDLGECEIAFPRIHHDHFPVNLVSVRVKHPDFCIETFHLKVLGQRRQTMSLRAGTKLRIGIADERGEMLASGGKLLIKGEWSSRMVTSEGGGWFTTSPLPPDTTMLYAVHIPEEGPVRFGGPYRWDPDNPATHEAIVPVVQGVPLKGKLSDNVPRPVLNGQVNVQVTVPQESGNSAWSVWTDFAKVAQDGSFEFPSLPILADAQLIAMCDGFLSAKPGPEELAEVTRRYSDQQVANVNAYEALPIVVEVGVSQDPIAISMQAAYSVRTQVVDPQGNAVPDAEVAAWPNQYHFGLGANVVGDCYPSRQILEMPDSDWSKVLMNYNRNPMTLRAKTNAEGIAVLKYLPPGMHSFNANHPAWETPLLENLRVEKVLVEGETQATVTVQAKAKPE